MDCFNYSAPLLDFVQYRNIYTLFSFEVLVSYFKLKLLEFYFNYKRCFFTGEEFPTEGTAFIFGKDISSHPKAARRHVGLNPWFVIFYFFLTATVNTGPFLSLVYYINTSTCRLGTAHSLMHSWNISLSKSILNFMLE